MRQGLLCIIGWAILAAAQTVAPPAKPSRTKVPSKPAAKPEPAPRSDAAQFLWERANILTQEIQQDGAKLDPQQQVILYGRLAGIWKADDPARAAEWRQKALDAVLHAPPGETPEQKQQRMGAEAALFQSVVASDPATAEQLLASMLQAMPHIDDPKYASPADAELQMKIVTAVMNGESDVIHDNPQRAMDMAERILAEDSVLGGSAMQTYLNLKTSTQPALAQKFLDDEIAQAQASNNMTLLASLSDLAIPQPGLPQEMIPPEEKKQSISNLVGQRIVQVVQNAAEQEQRCRFSGTATRLLPQMTPELQGQVQAAIEACKQAGLISPAAARSQQKFSQPPEAALQAADSETNIRQRTMDKVNAAVRLSQTDPFRALDVINGLSPEEKQSLPAWRMRLRNIAHSAMLKFFRAQDMESVRKVIDAVPDDDKPQLLLSAALQAALNGRPQQRDETAAMLWLQQARDLIGKVDLEDNWQPCVGLLNRYAQLVPEQAPLVAREAMTCLNNIKTYTPDEIRKRGYEIPPFSNDLMMEGLAPAVADIDPQAMQAAITLLDRASDRVTIRLAVLRVVLDAYRREMKPKRAE